ncbi:hypothetical protein KRR40_24760 [Niabella defluvii]|nr:hypothetical protein KRR40_24760 [Niabella sp. I65]
MGGMAHLPTYPADFCCLASDAFLSERNLSWRHYFGYTYIHMVLWNVLTTWWVAKASLVGE